MDPRILAAAAIAAGLWYGGKAVVHGASKAAHSVARVLTHGKAKQAEEKTEALGQ
jgi:hypothetical protein